MTWDGTVKPMQGAYADGAAAQLGFVVTTADGRTVGAALPIWVSSTTAMRGWCAGGRRHRRGSGRPGRGSTHPRRATVTDSTIAESLTRSVLVPFLRAWAVSDPVQLNLVLARDASTAARTGMAGQVTAPVVNRTQVVVTRGDPKGYRDGDLITAQVGVDWTTRARRRPAGRVLDHAADDRRPLAGHRHHRCRTRSRRGSGTRHDLRHPHRVTRRGIARSNHGNKKGR